MKAKISDSNFPVDAEGRVYHVSVKRGEVANRIVTAGDPHRIRRFAKFLDVEPQPFELMSSRGFLTITGRYKGTPLSLIAIGMGYSNMDFFVRECRHIVDGDMCIIRFGSCGSLDATLPVGSVGVARECIAISTNYDHWHDVTNRPPPFRFSKTIPSDPVLHDLLIASLRSTASSSTCEVRDVKVHASADLFYSSQGRIDPNFQDENTHLIKDLLRAYPGLTTLEMETAHLFHLAHIARQGKISAAATHLIFAGRVDEQHSFIDPDALERLEPIVGRACLDALVAFEIPVGNLHPDIDSVWK